MSIKFMTWTLHAPSTSTFEQYKKVADGEPWYSSNYITVDPDGVKKIRDHRQRSFIEMIEKYHEKIYSIGLHEFGTAEDGTIYNMGYGTHAFSYKVLNDAKTDIQYPVKRSLCYLMHAYPNIKWTIQLLCTTNSVGNRVEPVLDNVNGAQDTMIFELKKIAELYIGYGFPIRGIEIDFEKTTTRQGEDIKFKDLLVRVKNEVCIPLGLELRVNLFAMTGEYEPSYYGWHNYSTLASGVDINGNQSIDEFQLMTYDFSWGGSAPGPSTPLWWLERVLQHVRNVLPPDKTFIGNAGYGRRWPLDERRMGVTFDYKQLMQAQNGMYVHNDGSTSPDGNFYFRDQDFIPFTGFNDPDSDYQITYLHVYDSFKVDYGTLKGNIVRPASQGYVTTYSTQQNPIFTGIQARITKPSSVSGNASYSAVEDPPNSGNYVWDWRPGKIIYDGYEYDLYNVSRGRWIYDVPKNELGEPVPEEGRCVREPGPRGEDGSLVYNFNLPRSGSFKVIALVSFPFFGQDSFPITINGTTHVIGNGIPDWYPYITNPAWHFWDCGTYSLGTSNTINVGVTNGASIAGFIICEEFDPNRTGGRIAFPTNLQKMKKRGPKNLDGTSQIVDAKFPTKMKLTGELLRRPPRPAIIWEDMFGPHLRPDLGFTSSSDLANTVYYAKANPQSYTNGSGDIPYEVNGTVYCISGIEARGFSHNVWNVINDGTDAAHVRCNATSQYGQLVLNKLISSSAHIELDCRVSSTDINARYGIRVMQEKGNPSSGWIFRLNFLEKVVEFYNLNNNTRQVVNMSSALANGLGNRYTLTLQRIKGEWIFKVGSNTYFRIPDTIQGAVAYGAYATQCTIKVYRLNVSTLDRFEPMEKLNIYADGQKVAEYGEVARNVPYDEYGYLVHTALPGNLTEAVRAIPSDPDGTGQHSTVEGRAGTIFETEVEPHNWSLDYHNLPMTEMNSWIGKKDIEIEMKDPGIWMKKFYVGDSEGFSVAYNSDKIGFIRTAQMVIDYNCKGIAMWTLGQEDPTIFNYLPKSNE
ncbi:glycoside hydrolase [Geobacillus phage GR1]|nr:glycoside hydrolase [Geobacillus phage GR1]